MAPAVTRGAGAPSKSLRTVSPNYGRRLSHQLPPALSIAGYRENRRCGHFLSRASSPACAIASSISDLAPLAAIPPSVLPSTLMGSPPCLGKKLGNASGLSSPFFIASAASREGLP